MRPAADFAFRVLFSLIFIVAGSGHLVRPSYFIERLNESPIGTMIVRVAPAEFLMMASGIVLGVAGLALLLGYFTKPAAALLVLVLVLVPITVTVHLGTGSDPGPLLKNIALLGGLIHFVVQGAAEWSLDSWRSRR